MKCRITDILCIDYVADLSEASLNEDTRVHLPHTIQLPVLSATATEPISRIQIQINSYLIRVDCI